jgi:hypothetical protein
MLDHYKYHKQFFENGIYGLLSRVDRNPDDEEYGYVRNNWSDYYEGDWYFGIALAFVEAYYIEGIRSYHDDELLRAVDDIYSAIEKYIHEDGTMDLRVTNYHDPSLCAFVVRDTAGPMLELFDTFSTHTELEDKTEAHLRSIVKKMAPAIKHLGFHTPNHRWIFCAALSYIKKYLGDNEAQSVMDKFFWEGIDCDEYGEYTERSTGLYNRICNHSFVSLAHTYDKKFIEYPTRNMRLMRSFYEPDNSICTLGSLRQDKGKSQNVDFYYMIYLPLALSTRDPEFAFYSDRALNNILADGIKNDRPIEYIDAFIMYFLMSEPEWTKSETYESIPSYLPKRDLDIFLPNSGTGRVYLDGGATATVLRTSAPDFFKFQIGKYSIVARAGGAFFGNPHSQFRPKKMEKTENGFRLISNEEAGYRSQLDEPPETSDWHRMDHSKRHILNVRRFDTVVDISFSGRKVAFDVDFGGDEYIPVKFELTMTPGGKVETDNMNFIARAGDYVYLKNGGMTMRFDGGTSVKICGGAYKHFTAEDMRGTEHVPSDSFTVCFTGSTPDKLHFEIEY